MPEDAENGDSKETIWERRVTVLLITLLLGVGGWTALGVHNQSSLVARIEERLNSLSLQLGEMRGALQKQYTKDDAARDLGVRDRQIQDLQQRVRRLERDSE